MERQSDEVPHRGVAFALEECGGVITIGASNALMWRKPPLTVTARHMGVCRRRPAMQQANKNFRIEKL
jgi:hypothetical protein